MARYSPKKTDPIKDGMGRPVPPRLDAPFSTTRIAGFLKESIAAVQLVLRQFKDQPGCEQLSADRWCDDLQALWTDLHARLPFIPCPCLKGCNLCQHRQWLSLIDVQRIHAMRRGEKLPEPSSPLEQSRDAAIRRLAEGKLGLLEPVGFSAPAEEPREILPECGSEAKSAPPASCAS